MFIFQGKCLVELITTCKLFNYFILHCIFMNKTFLYRYFCILPPKIRYIIKFTKVDFLKRQINLHLDNFLLIYVHTPSLASIFNMFFNCYEISKSLFTIFSYDVCRIRVLTIKWLIDFTNFRPVRPKLLLS